MVWFLINDAPFMAGCVIILDGGYVLGGDKVTPMSKGAQYYLLQISDGLILVVFYYTSVVHYPRYDMHFLYKPEC
ncbi:hypothetical protein [Desulfobacterium sp. N47]